MKKFLSVIAVCAMMLGVGVSFSACGNENAIKYDQGEYECEIVQDSVQFNENLSAIEKESYLDMLNTSSDLDIDDFDTGYTQYVLDSWENTFFKFNKKSFEVINYTVVEEDDIKSFLKTTISIDKYKFKDNKLTSDIEGEKYEFTELEDGSLLLTYTESYDFGFTEIEYKPIVSISFNLTKATEETDYPSAETMLYPDKTVKDVYDCSSVELVWENELTKTDFYTQMKELGIKDDKGLLEVIGISEDSLSIITFTDNSIAYTGSLSGFLDTFTEEIGMSVSVEATSIYNPTLTEGKYIIDECTSFMFDNLGNIVYSIDYEAEPLMDMGYDIKVVFQKSGQ